MGRENKGVEPFHRLILVMTVLAAATLCRADSITSNLMFQTANQNMWNGSGTTAVSGQIFSASLPISFNQGFGSLDPTRICFFGSCFSDGTFGYQVQASLNGSVGVSMSLIATGGSINAGIPVNVTTGFPSAVANNTPFQLTSSALFQSGATLQTFSPGVAVSMNGSANLSGGINATACFGGCTGGGVTLNTNGQQNFNIFTAALTPHISLNPSPFVSVGVGVPFVSTFASNSQSQSSPTLNLTSDGASASFLTVNANLANIAAAALGLPPLSASFDIGSVSLDYDLFTLEAGLGLSADQSFSLTATPEIAYNLDYLGADPMSQMTDAMPVGTPVSLSIPNGDYAVDVTPNYSMSAMIDNETGLTPELEASLGALEFKFGPLGVGPLVEGELSLPLGFHFPLYSNDFALSGWNTASGDTFQIDATNTTPEPATLLLFGTGVLLAAWSWRRRRLGLADERG